MLSSLTCRSNSIVRRPNRNGRRFNVTNNGTDIVYFSKLKSANVVVLPRSRSNTSGRDINSIDMIVDGSAFKSIDDVQKSENIIPYGRTHSGFEYPLKLEIFNHIRSEPRPLLCKTEPIYYVAIVQTDLFIQESEVAEHLIPKGYKFYLIQYNPILTMFTCDWRDDLAIESVIFGPKLIEEMLNL